jgi:uncharacterized membrane protein YfcA
MDYLILVSIGIVMGLFGGLLGIGGSVVMIPAMVIFFGPNQHLYQASAMICNFFVAISAVIVHRKEKVLVVDVIKWLAPAALVGIIAGVALSNIDFFSGENTKNLTRAFGLFLVYVVIYNLLKFRSRDGGSDGLDLSRTKHSTALNLLIGLITGISGGLLGMGGGAICTPAQQLFLKMPLKRAISNSAALISATAIVGALYKNFTLSQHNIAVLDSVKIAAIIIPTASIASFAGGRLMHILHKRIVRIAYIGLLIVASYKMLMV